MILAVLVFMSSCGKNEEVIDSTSVSITQASEPSVEVIEPSQANPPTYMEASESTETVTSSELSEIPEHSIESTELMDEPIKGAEERDSLKSTYADIDLSAYEDYISFDNYPWFELPEGMLEWDYSTYQYIVCAINEYYGGEVKGTYTCDINSDIVSMESNMVWKIKVTGSENTLLVGINGYENTASVEIVE